jgi:bisphosphoglycerate-dependent phosphoglycerate mutase
MLRIGGHVIVIRHGATNADMADTDPLNHDNIAMQRQLSRKGEEAAKALGDAFKSIGVPVGQVYTSRFNRAYQSAKLAGFDKIEKSIDLTEGGLVVSPNENNRRVAAFRKLARRYRPAQPTSSSSRTSRTSLMHSKGLLGEKVRRQPAYGKRLRCRARTNGRMVAHRSGREK